MIKFFNILAFFLHSAVHYFSIFFLLSESRIPCLQIYLDHNFQVVYPRASFPFFILLISLSHPPNFLGHIQHTNLALNTIPYVFFSFPLSRSGFCLFLAVDYLFGFLIAFVKRNMELLCIVLVSGYINFIYLNN